MSKVNKLKPIASALGATLIAGLAASPVAQANENPFAVSEMKSGYMVAMAGDEKKKEEKKEGEGKCGEGKCGEGKKEGEGKCGEGKCGDKKTDDDTKKPEGKCGEGKCGAA